MSCQESGCAACFGSFLQQVTTWFSDKCKYFHIFCILQIFVSSSTSHESKKCSVERKKGPRSIEMFIFLHEQKNSVKLDWMNKLINLKTLAKPFHCVVTLWFLLKDDAITQVFTAICFTLTRTLEAVTYPPNMKHCRFIHYNDRLKGKN